MVPKEGEGGAGKLLKGGPRVSQRRLGSSNAKPSQDQVQVGSKWVGITEALGVGHRYRRERRNTAMVVTGPSAIGQ